jgi:uncharacterized membrane protein YkvA (DUF1232 family)
LEKTIVTSGAAASCPCTLAKGSTSPASWKKQAERLHREALVLYFVFKNRRTPWYVRGMAACCVSYVFSPVQLIPSFIPVIGFLDDFLFLFVGAKLVRWFTPPDLLRECSEQAEVAAARRSEEMPSGMSRFTIVLSVTAWLLVAVAASALLAAHFYK